MASRNSKTTLVFDKHETFRQRIVLATLTGKPIVVNNIRSRSDNPGLREYEIELLRMVQQISNGARVEINESGTRLVYSPGSLHGGAIECSFSLARPVSYYLEVLFYLAPFMKHPVSAVLKGVTHYFDELSRRTQLKRAKQGDMGSKDAGAAYTTYPSCDALAAVSLPIIRAFLGEDSDKEVDLTVRKRGVLPNGGGEVHFTCGVRAQLRAVRFLHEASTDKPVRVRRIRGVAWTARVAPTASARLIDAARHVLNSCCADVYVTAQHCRGEQAGKSPGFGLLLVAEYSNSSLRHIAERISLPRQSANAEADDEQLDGSSSAVTEQEARRREINVPERIGEACAIELLRSVRCGGAVDRSQQSLVLTLMAFTAAELNKIETSVLTPYAIDTIRAIHAFTGMKYRIETVSKPKNFTADADSDEEPEDSDDESEQLLTITCVGMDYANLNRAIL